MLADLDLATNDFKRLLRGQERQVLEEPYIKAKSFAKKFQSNLTMWKIEPTWAEKRDARHPLAESAMSPLNDFVSREVEAEKFKDPYGAEFKKLLYDMYANDYMASGAVDIRNWGAFSPQSEVTCMPMNEKVYESDAELESDLDDAMSKQERKDLINYVEKVNRFTKFRYHQQDLGIQSMVGGRAACFIETYQSTNPYGFPVGTPAVLKPLHWSFLNQVRVDTASWGLDAIRYTDFESLTQDSRVFIPASRLIYVTRNDHHVTPNNLWYGLSDFHPIWKISNIIRQCEEVDIPEIVTSFWSGGGWFEFTNMNTAEMDKFMDSIGPGLIRGYNARAKFTPFNLKHDGWFIITLIQNMMSHMLMKLRVPEFLFNFEKATSRSAVEIQMNAFRDIVLANDRWWMEKHLQDQWYDHLVGLWINQPDPKLHKIRLVQNYVPLSMEDILAKANSIELLIRRYILDRYEARELLGYKRHNKNLDKNVNEIGQLKDLSPVEKLQQAHAEKMQKQKMEQQKQTSLDNFGPKGFTATAPQRSNSAPLGSVGAGRGNTT